MHVPSPDQGTRMLDGQRNHSAHIHSMQMLVKWLTLQVLQYRQQLPNTIHQFALPSETVWEEKWSVMSASHTIMFHLHFHKLLRLIDLQYLKSKIFSC